MIIIIFRQQVQTSIHYLFLWLLKKEKKSERNNGSLYPTELMVQEMTHMSMVKSMMNHEKVKDRR